MVRPEEATVKSKVTIRGGLYVVYLVKATCVCEPTHRILVYTDGHDEPIRSDDVFSLDDDKVFDAFLAVTAEFRQVK